MFLLFPLTILETNDSQMAPLIRVDEHEENRVWRGSDKMLALLYVLSSSSTPQPLPSLCTFLSYTALLSLLPSKDPLHYPS